jgi:hypothetical protein
LAREGVLHAADHAGDAPLTAAALNAARNELARIYGGWNRFWFEPQETSTLALVRIAYGVVMFFWTLSQLPTLFTFYSDGGIVPVSYDGIGRRSISGAWSVLSLFPGDWAVVTLFVLMLLASLSVAAGFFPRVGALILFVGTVSLQRRDPYVHNAGDVLLRIMPLYLFLSPCGAALSLDRLRKHRDRFWEFPKKPQVTLRLMQLQVSFVYLNSVWAKVRGTTWNDGTAVSYALRIGDLHRLPVPSFLTSSELLANFLTYGALAIELSMATLVWNRKARPYVLLAGVSLHLGIDWGITVGFFSYAILLYYLAFLPPEAVSTQVLRLRDRVLRRRRRTPAHAA